MPARVRAQINDAMMRELGEVRAAVSPTDTLLVVDAMTGQEAAGLVKAFNDAAELTGEWSACFGVFEQPCGSLHEGMQCCCVWWFHGRAGVGAKEVAWALPSLLLVARAPHCSVPAACCASVNAAIACRPLQVDLWIYGYAQSDAKRAQAPS